VSYERFHRNGPAPITRPQPSLSSPADLAEDNERGQFLQHLDAAPVEVTEFEAKFIESYFQAVLVQNQRGWWTENRRRVCDKMRQTYSGGF